MKKGKMFKKSISCLLAALMIIASMPFSAISASAATGTLSAKSYEIVRGGGNTRWENNQFNIVNDQEADNTSIGIIKYDISSLQGMVINSASLNFTIDSYIGDSQGLVFYYSNRLTNVTLNKNSTKDTLTNTSYGAGTVANESAASRYGFSTGNVLAYGNVNTSAQTSDIKTQLQTIVDSGATSLYVFVMQKNAGGSNNARLSDGVHDDKTGWTDTKIKPTNVTINVNYDVDNRPVTLDQAKAKLNSFSYSGNNEWDYGSFKEDNTDNWASGKNYTSYMKNVLYGEKLTIYEAGNGSFVNNMQTWIKYPQLVFLYDGTTNLDAPVLLQIASNTRSERKIQRANVEVTDLALTRSRWNGTDKSDNWVWLYSKEVQTDQGGTGTTSNQNSWVSAWNYKEKYYRHANMIRFTGKMSNSEYTRSIRPVIKAYVDGGNVLTNSGERAYYYVNYQAILNKIDQAKSDINTVKDEYSERTKSAYAKALYDLVTFDPTSLSFSGSTLDDDVATAGGKIKTLIENYDNAYRNLSIDYTFKKVDGSTTTVPAKNADEAYANRPTNNTAPNSEQLSETQHTKYTYTWPTSPSDYVFTEQKEEVTENHDFRTLDTCTCGAKVDVESFEAAKKEADVVLTQSSLYEDTSYKNFSKTVTDAGSKRSKGELLCQADFDNATFEILYAKTLLKKKTGTVILTVYDQNNQEITGAGNTYNNNYGDEITIKPATEQNVYKYVIEKDGATSEIYGQPSISYVVTGNATVKAYCNKAQSADEKYTKVTFLVGGKISDIKYVKEGETLDTSTANKLQFPFFTTGDWDQTSVQGSAEVSSVTVRAELKPYNDNKCNVHFAGGNEASLAYNTKVDVIADYQMDQGFDYALSTSLKTDDIIAYMHGTVFYVPARSEVFVIKVPKGDSAKHPKINTVGVFTSYDEKYKYVGFNCKFSLPADCTPVEWGITFIPILQSGRPETSKVFRVKPLSAENEYTATLSLTKTNSKYSAIRAKAYLKYKDANNNIQVIEGDEHIQAFASENKFGITDINQNQN